MYQGLALTTERDNRNRIKSVKNTAKECENPCVNQRTLSILVLKILEVSPGKNHIKNSSAKASD